MNFLQKLYHKYFVTANITVDILLSSLSNNTRGFFCKDRSADRRNVRSLEAKVQTLSNPNESTISPWRIIRLLLLKIIVTEEMRELA